MPQQPPPRRERRATASIVGAGPAGLIAAEVLARGGVDVTVYDAMPSPLRKFLLAGHGGLNITHSEERAAFLGRYGDSAPMLGPMIERFSPDDLRSWCAGLGEETFVGSSRRVFPKSFRANPLVRAWLARLAQREVTLVPRHIWTGWTDDGARHRFTSPLGEVEVASDLVILALGGASWPSLGSNGSWVAPFTARGVEITPLRPANVGVRVAWSEIFATRFAGSPLKHVALTVRGRADVVGRGDAMVTEQGLEAGPIYAIGAPTRAALDDGDCVLEVDLRPDVGSVELAERLHRRRPKDSVSTWLRRSIGLDPVSIGLLREASGGAALPSEPSALVGLIKAVPIPVTSAMPIERAISTAGGIAWSQVDDALMLRTMPGTFVAGEMLDWEAPTGGYLLQASFATGVAAAQGALEWWDSAAAQEFDG